MDMKIIFKKDVLMNKMLLTKTQTDNQQVRRRNPGFFRKDIVKKYKLLKL